jgi:hypothetical protein
MSVTHRVIVCMSSTNPSWENKPEEIHLNIIYYIYGPRALNRRSHSEAKEGVSISGIIIPDLKRILSPNPLEVPVYR